jgi:hypothetical protein
MSLVNVGYAVTLTWSDPKTRLLEDQMMVPMYGDHPDRTRSRSGKQVDAGH